MANGASEGGRRKFVCETHVIKLMLRDAPRQMLNRLARINEA